MAFLLDGKEVSMRIRQDVAEAVKEFKNRHKFTPRLSIIQVGDDPASSVYIRQKEKACAEVGIISNIYHIKCTNGFQAEVDVAKVIDKLNHDPNVHGIILQLPLPSEMQYATRRLLNIITPSKDVDCLTEASMGKLFVSGRKSTQIVYPCTASGIMELADAYNLVFTHTNCTIIGRSNIVGKPLAAMLLNRDASVSVCHSQTKSLYDYTKNADVLVVATGHMNLITPDMVKKNAIVFDVGINRGKDGKLHGDVHPDVSDIASYITPVPGGVGPMTVAMVLKNTFALAKRSIQSKFL